LAGRLGFDTGTEDFTVVVAFGATTGAFTGALDIFETDFVATVDVLATLLIGTLGDLLSFFPTLDGAGAFVSSFTEALALTSYIFLSTSS